MAKISSNDFALKILSEKDFEFEIRKKDPLAVECAFIP